MGQVVTAEQDNYFLLSHLTEYLVTLQEVVEVQVLEWQRDRVAPGAVLMAARMPEPQTPEAAEEAAVAVALGVPGALA
jgi:hypothetical protein